MVTTSKVGLLIAPRGTEDVEFAKPKAALEQAGFKVVVIGLSGKLASTVENDLDPAHDYPIDVLISHAKADDYVALIIPGGTVGADQLRAEPAVIKLVNEFAAQEKIIASICHGPWVLAEAGLVNDVTLTSFPSIRTDLENAGASWKDQEVVIDQGIITSRNPKDIPAFNNAIIEALTS